MNPAYQITFSLNNEKYLIDIQARAMINLNKSFDNPLTTNIVLSESSKFRVTLNKVTSDGYMSFEDYKEFNNYNEVMNYLREWKNKLD